MEEELVWIIERKRDDLSTMDDAEEQLENGGIDDWEEGFIRGFTSAS